jgi:hypothetical protein
MSRKSSIVAFYALILMCSGCSSSFAQHDTVPAISVSANIDIMSRYIWRGQDYGQCPSIQPGLSATWKGFTLGAWGAYKITGPGEQETDLYLSKTVSFVTFSVWDYWTFCDTSFMDVLNYNPHTTNHLLEFQVLLSGGDKVPFNLLGSYFFYGTDASRSIYLELQFLHSFGIFDMQVFSGFQVKGEYYAPIPAWVNVGLTVIKKIPVTKSWSLPVTLSFVVNTYSRYAYLIAGLTF